jgi:hypothetical protein
MGGGAGKLKRERDLAMVVQATRRARRGPFIAAGKAVTRPAPCTRTTCGRQWWRRRFGKAPGVDSVGGIRGQIGGGAVG